MNSDPQQLKKSSMEELRSCAEDLRQEILSTCLGNGGHLGASLGAVELAIALHYVFDSPREPLVWDVGHQAYAHKIITGRAPAFSTLRQFGGISGFLSRAESPHDVFGAGHSSTSISAALAMAWARKESRDWTVAIIGDGGLTAGLAFEALNNVRAQSTGPMLVVLNDNQMSIAPNVGAVSSFLQGSGAKEYFSLFGFEYVGPIDGHQLEQLIGALRAIRGNPGRAPILLHVLTQKGKGYAPAEENPGEYHGIGPVSPAKVGDAPAGKKNKSFSQSFGEALIRLAEKDPRIVAITAAMPEGTGLTEFSRRFPERFFDVGIAEPHAVTFAAGLATQGFRPVVAIYSTFLQRGLDSLIHDVALQNLPVIFALDRAGLVGADGPTHHGLFDLPYLGMIPGMSVWAPETLSDLDSTLSIATQASGPVAIRYPRGSAPESSPVALRPDGTRWHQVSQAPELIVASVGTASRRTADALSKLDEKSRRAVSWVSVLSVKPTPQSLTEAIARHSNAQILCVEDGIIHGGFGQQIGATEIIGYERFVPHGRVEELEREEQTSSDAIESRIRAILSRK